jgi:2-oxoglutarate dehydrogenase E1 component
MIDYTAYGLTENDLDKTFYIDGSQLEGLFSFKQEWKLGELIEALQNAYCQKIGLDYMHVHDRDQCKWIRNKFEKA